MKIAFVNDTFIEGRGVDVVIYELARRLGKKYEVYVIATEVDILEENFKTIRIKAKKLLTGNIIKDSFSYLPNILKFRKEILKLQKKYKFDVLNVHHSSLNPAFGSLPVVVTWHGTPSSNNYIRTIFNKIVLKSLRKNKLTITISNFMEEELSKIINPKKIKKIYNGVNEEFKFKNKDDSYMFFVGRLEKHKSVHEIIKLSKEINYPLHIAGSGPLENKLKKYSQKIDANNIKFLGKISKKELINQYQRCSFFISASKWEGFGLIFIEAAACAKSSIGYRKGSIPEVIINEETGFLVNNFFELKQKVKELIKDKKLRKKLGKEALKFSKKFSWENSAKEYEKIFEGF